MLSGWGRYPRIDTTLITARTRDDIQAALFERPNLIARGMGRAYGDAALNANTTLSLQPFDRFLAFDEDTGLLTCEGGTKLADILKFFVPRGWFPPVTPGTKFVTIGGMIAADVHGKNHHIVGSFGDHVTSFKLALADGSVVTCSRTENAEFFAATVGGMGLTGVILEASFRLLPIESAWMRQTTQHAHNLEEAMVIFEESRGVTYSVAWIDGLARGEDLGRSVMYLGEHARHDEIDENFKPPHHRVRRVPFDLPSFTLNRWSVRAFNHFYYERAKASESFVDYEKFFYPLDAVQDWNRIYGRRGFVQYQCVLPKHASAAGMKKLLERIANSWSTPFLAVLKLLGQGNHMLSFPMEGYTLALDFPAKASTFKLFAELDAIVTDHGGRLYLAKDSCMSAEMLRRGYPWLGDFLAVRRRIDPMGKFSSLQSERLGL